MPDFFVYIIIALLIGISSGILSGIFGVGGATITLPFMRLFLGVPGKIAIGTALPTVIPTAISGFIVHYKKGLVRTKIGLICGLSGSLSAFFGAWCTKFFEGNVLMIFTSVFIFITAVRFILENIKTAKRKNTNLLDDKTKGGERGKIARKENVKFLRIFSIGFMTGFLSGFLGIGGGSVLVPAFVIFLGISMHEAVATSLLSIILMAIPGSIEHVLLNNTNIYLFAVITVGAILGSQIGARLSIKTKERLLAYLFSAFLISMSLWLGISEFLNF